MKEIILGGLGVLFGSICLYLGHNDVVIYSVFALLGGIIGYGIKVKKE